MSYFISYISRLNVASKLPWFSLYAVSTSAAVLHTGHTNFSKNLLPSQNCMGVKLRYDCSESNLSVFLANVKTSRKGGKIYFCFTFAIPRHIQSFKNYPKLFKQSSSLCSSEIAFDTLSCW